MSSRVTCREVAELLIDFVEGELPEMQMLSLQRHICACPPCLFYMETYQTTIEATRALPEEPLPPEFEARLRSVLENWEAERAKDGDGKA
jgi:anti-sigma factor RsiW